MSNSTITTAKSQGFSAEDLFIQSLVRLASAWNAKLTLHSRHFSPLSSMYRNCDTLRQIPILEVARALGIDVVKTGSGIHAMREEMEITSLVLFENTNTWKRFSGKEQGGVSQGSPIDLVMHARSCSFREACEYLTSAFPQHI